MIDSDAHYMRLALDEAKKGLGRTSPNPVVGAVIVRDDRVVAKGFHRKAGAAHAEIEALKNVGSDLLGATMYVTLEPCSHTGLTPPCCKAIAQTGIRRVVVGMQDPNPLVNGQGIAYLREQGLEVRSAVLEQECRAINRPFIKFVQTSLPYMVMKAGVSLDGRLNYTGHSPGKITGDESWREVHRLRDRYDAIMVGSGTILSDDPALTTRLPGGQGRDPVRLILDSHLRIPDTAKVYNLDSPAISIVFCKKGLDSARREKLAGLGVEVFEVSAKNNGLDLIEVMQNIGQQGILSVLVEGGSRLHGSLLRRQLYDYAHLFYAPVFAGDCGQPLAHGLSVSGAVSAPRLFQPIYKQLGEDMLVEGLVLYP